MKILIRAHGPYVVPTDGLELVDEQGNLVPLPEGKERVSLCRCGKSARMPFCDSTHKTIEFHAPILVEVRQP